MKRLIIILLLAVVLISCSAPANPTDVVSTSGNTAVIQIYADDTVRILEIQLFSNRCFVTIAQSTGISSMACF